MPCVLRRAHASQQPSSTALRQTGGTDATNRNMPGSASSLARKMREERHGRKEARSPGLLSGDLVVWRTK